MATPNADPRSALKAVVSDILIGSSEITNDAFARMLTNIGPTGYEDFRHQMDGEYEFQRAIFKASLNSGGESLPRIETLANWIDVPDIFDRGSSPCSASGPVWVPFKRQFYFVDEIVATLKGGTAVAAPIVSGITLTGFFVEALNPNNTRMDGVVSWSAKGY